MGCAFRALPLECFVKALTGAMHGCHNVAFYRPPFVDVKSGPDRAGVPCFTAAVALVLFRHHDDSGCTAARLEQPQE
jgi:hypothetical protein